jgi:hypothetical protein
MIILRKFSKTLNTTGISGFRRGRKYDQDFDRLGRLETQRQMAGTDLNKEMRKLRTELNDGRLGKWQDTD